MLQENETAKTEVAPTGKPEFKLSEEAAIMFFIMSWNLHVLSGQ